MILFLPLNIKRQLRKLIKDKSKMSIKEIDRLIPEIKELEEEIDLTIRQLAAERYNKCAIKNGWETMF